MYIYYLSKSIHYHSIEFAYVQTLTVKATRSKKEEEERRLREAEEDEQRHKEEEERLRLLAEQ